MTSLHPNFYTFSVPDVPKCTYKYTGWNSRGGGDSVYLDRHWVVCGGGYAMRYFRLQRSGNSIRYQFLCCTLQPYTVTAYPTKYTPFNADGNGDFVYLDRHQPYCWNYGNSFIRYFRLGRNGGHNQWRYQYGCSNVNKAISCYDRHTGFTYDGNGRVEYLDRNFVYCNSGYFIQSFRLQRNSGHNHIRYWARCCKYA